MKFNDVKVTSETIKTVEKSDDNFNVITDKQEYLTKTVILTTGSQPRKLNVPGEKEYFNKGLTYCSICDGPLFSGKEVAIIGAGASALEAVDFMKEIATKIYVLVKGNKFTGHQYLIDRVSNNPKVEVLFNADTKEIVGDKFVNGVKYTQKGKENTLNVSGVIIEIGRIPNTKFISNLVELDEHKHIKIDCNGNTNTTGIFAAGDCASGHEYQYIISAGQGCMALLKAARYLAGKK